MRVGRVWINKTPALPLTVTGITETHVLCAGEFKKQTKIRLDRFGYRLLSNVTNS